MTYSRSILLALLWTAVVRAFVPFGRMSHSTVTYSTKSSMKTTTMAAANSIVVISPPGGVGEVAAVKAACRGSAVRWFIITNTQGYSVSLAPQTLEDISASNGALDVAGATVEDLKSGGEELAAVSKWCGTADGIICTYDGTSGNLDFQAALRLATQQASGGIQGTQVAVLAAEEDLEEEVNDNEGVDRFLSGLFRNSPPIPSSLPKSFSGKGSVCVVRHGQLFGLPESSPDFSPLVGGPRRDPEITEEYTMRSVRVDPYVFLGNIMASSSSRTCRHCVGEAAAFFATGKLAPLSQAVTISSQAGMEERSLEQWKEELDRVKELVASGKASTLFNQEMVVEDTERLADWLAAKWAPAVLRTYDIAAIRIGARPVYAARAGDGLVEISWQELVNFDSVIVGKMLIKVSSDGIVATRGAGDSTKGFGDVDSKPLPGEDVLVRRLAEAASQAVEKGLAKKVKTKKPIKVTVDTPKPATTLQAAGNIEMEPQPVTQEASKIGPRQAGARRSTPRSRGTRKTS
ncbi:hypothetical protein IV203_010255 [Nitzschia inconspicua]|uniref:Uncharacterized protein n=1 Tax=Nitzschia inconspicua TaxID=303405 RepID=A0A9K3KXB8_9STRA|nr:hypothetical protein IV203_010255 [Nitzschia inconspicua]